LQKINSRILKITNPMNTENFFTEQIEWIAAGIAAVISFFGGRKSKKISDKTSELENLEKVRLMEKQLVDDVKKQVDELREINTGLQVIIEQKDEIIDKQQEVIDQQRELILIQKEEIIQLKESCVCKN